MSEAKHVYTAINQVTAAMASEGLGKTRSNTQQGYKFRGIDDVYNALARHLAAAKLCILPMVVDRVATERPTKSGGVSTYTFITIDFDLVSAVDGSVHTIRTVGEAMDTADKSTNKAMSAAMKYACLLAFQIPTEGDNDADFSHHEKSEPSLEKALQASVDWGDWEKRQTAALRKAVTRGDLSEIWTKATDEGKGSPNGTMKRLAEVKNDMKSKLNPANGEAHP